MEGGEEVKCYCLEGDSFSFFLSFFFLSLPSDLSTTNTADADTPSLSLHDVEGLRVRNSRHSTSSETLCVRNIYS